MPENENLGEALRKLVEIFLAIKQQEDTDE